MAKITIGQNGGKVVLDLDRLIVSRLLVQGASGSGKSWLLRVLAEQAGNHIPIIILDPEGEFATLRERLDVVLVGADGSDLPADPKNAAMLARRIVELKLSTVIDLYELDWLHRRLFVKHFLDGLMGLPKRMWGPRLVILDEAHNFCPEGKGCESNKAVERLMSQGRKRGFCGVLATQRLSKLDKDAAAECGTILIGRTSPVDKKRAADILGIAQADRHEFGKLAVGEWLGFGSSLDAADVVRFTSATPKTSHPKAGAGKTVTPAPSATIQGVLGELQELARKDSADPITLDEAKEDIAKLRKELRTAQRAVERAESKTVVDQDAIDRAVASATKSHEDCIGRLCLRIEQLSSGADDLRKSADIAVEEAKRFALTPSSVSTKASSKVRSVNSGIKKRPPIIPNSITRPRSTPRSNGKAASGQTRMIQALANRYPAGFTEAQWATMAGLKRTGGTWSTYKSRLVTGGLVEDRDGLWYATESGVDEYSDEYSTPLTQDEVIEDWKRKLGRGPARIIDFLVEYAGESIEKASLAEAVGLTHGAGTFSTYLSRVRSNGLCVVDGGYVRASDELLGLE